MNSSNRLRPIGVFDSGLGGLTVVKAIRQILPSESVVYFGDIARLPYGIKSKEQILSYSIQNTLFLMKKKVKAVVIACNSSSSASYAFLKRSFSLPIVDVIEPAVEAALQGVKSKRIGVIATQSTIASKAYEKALRRLKPSVKVVAAPCPLFVPLVEEGWTQGSVTDQVAAHYLQPLIETKIDTLILGCTHYPLLRNTIQKIVGNHVRLVDSALPTAEKLASLLNKNGLSYAGRGHSARLKVYVSDLPRNFIKIGEQFLEEKLRDVEIVRQR